MSEKTQNLTSVTESADSQETETPKTNPFRKYVVNPIKKHPKAATAVGLGLAVVAGAAFTGRGKSPELEFLENVEDETESEDESTDTNVA